MSPSVHPARCRLPAAGLVADLEPIGQTSKDAHHLLDASHLRAVGDLPRLVNRANRDARQLINSRSQVIAKRTRAKNAVRALVWCRRARPTCIGLALPVRITEDELIVYGPDVKELVRHRLLPRQVTGQRCEYQEHRPSDDPQQRLAMLRERFFKLGPIAQRFLDGLLRDQRYGKAQAGKVLALLGTYNRRDLARSSRTRRPLRRLFLPGG